MEQETPQDYHIGGKSVREYLRANMFDGDEGGILTQNISSLLDEIVELIMELDLDRGN